jgi:hypothetical protein
VRPCAGVVAGAADTGVVPVAGAATGLGVETGAAWAGACAAGFGATCRTECRRCARWALRRRGSAPAASGRVAARRGAPSAGAPAASGAGRGLRSAGRAGEAGAGRLSSNVGVVPEPVKPPGQSEKPKRLAPIAPMPTKSAVSAAASPTARIISRWKCLVISPRHRHARDRPQVNPNPAVSVLSPGRRRRVEHAVYIVFWM